MSRPASANTFYGVHYLLRSGDVDCGREICAADTASAEDTFALAAAVAQGHCGLSTHDPEAITSVDVWRTDVIGTETPTPTGSIRVFTRVETITRVK